MVTILLDTMLYINYICVLLPNSWEDLSRLNNKIHATLMFYLLQKNGNKIIGHMPFINAKFAVFLVRKPS